MSQNVREICAKMKKNVRDDKENGKRMQKFVTVGVKRSPAWKITGAKGLLPEPCAVPPETRRCGADEEQSLETGITTYHNIYQQNALISADLS